MAPKAWATNEQQEFLLRWMPDFMRRQAEHHLNLFWAPMWNAWFSQFPEHTVLGLPLPSDAEARKLTEEELNALGQAITKRKGQLENWFRYRRKKIGGTESSAAPDAAPAVKGLFKLNAPKRRRAHQPIEVYQKRNSQAISDMLSQEGYDKLKDDDNGENVREDESDEQRKDRLKDMKSQRMRLRTRVVKTMFGEASEEELAAIQEEIEQEKKEIREEELEDESEVGSGEPKVSTPKDFQDGIDALEAVCAQVHKAMYNATGWVGVTLIGGPNPRLGGDLSMKVFNFGKSAAGNDFEDACIDFDKNVLQPFGEWLGTCFTAEERKLRAIAPKSDQTLQEPPPTRLLPAAPANNDSEANPTKKKVKKKRTKKRSHAAIDGDSTLDSTNTVSPSPLGSPVVSLPDPSSLVTNDGDDSALPPVPVSAVSMETEQTGDAFLSFGGTNGDVHLENGSIDNILLSFEGDLANDSHGGTLWENNWMAPDSSWEPRAATNTPAITAESLWPAEMSGPPTPRTALAIASLRSPSAAAEPPIDPWLHDLRLPNSLSRPPSSSPSLPPSSPSLPPLSPAPTSLSSAWSTPPSSDPDARQSDVAAAPAPSVLPTFEVGGYRFPAQSFPAPSVLFQAFGDSGRRLPPYKPPHMPKITLPPPRKSSSVVTVQREPFTKRMARVMSAIIEESSETDLITPSSSSSGSATSTVVATPVSASAVPTASGRSPACTDSPLASPVSSVMPEMSALSSPALPVLATPPAASPSPPPLTWPPPPRRALVVSPSSSKSPLQPPSVSIAPTRQRSSCSHLLSRPSSVTPTLPTSISLPRPSTASVALSAPFLDPAPPLPALASLPPPVSTSAMPHPSLHVLATPPSLPAASKTRPLRQPPSSALPPSLPISTIGQAAKAANTGEMVLPACRPSVRPLPRKKPEKPAVDAVGNSGANKTVTAAKQNSGGSASVLKPSAASNKTSRGSTVDKNPPAGASSAVPPPPASPALPPPRASASAPEASSAPQYIFSIGNNNAKYLRAEAKQRKAKEKAEKEEEMRKQAARGWIESENDGSTTVVLTRARKPTRMPDGSLPTRQVKRQLSTRPNPHAKTEAILLARSAKRKADAEAEAVAPVPKKKQKKK